MTNGENDVINEDKKVIGDEEREKMLNRENVLKEDITNKIEEIDKIDKEKELEKEKEADGDVEKEVGVVKTGEVEKMKKQLEESQKDSRLSSIRVPIGGIKIPGFLRSRSRDKNKETDGTTEEAVDLLEVSGHKSEKTDKAEKSEGGLRATLARRLDTLSSRNPFAKKDASENADVSAGEPRSRLLDRIKLPAVNVLPKRFRRDNKDQKDGAELTSVTVAEDGKPPSPDDGMESVKLDGDGDVEKDVEKAGLAGDTSRRPFYLIWWDRMQRLSRHEKAIGAAVILLFLLLLIIFVATSGGSIPTAPPIVNGKVITTTQCGPVEGSQSGEIFAFLGIPFAAPPIGVQRWKPAQPLTSLNLCWNDTLYHAVSSSSNRQCWQEITPDKIDGFEDCLYLDIWTPEVRYINPVPVVVLIDATTLLGGNSNFTPTSKLVHEREVVFVRPNFRLGVLGFLAAAPLSSAVYPPTSGNYGLSDILVALRWVQTNIAHFGGDPTQVTLVGHRAGASLVTALATSPAAKGLFKRAWASSGSAIYPGEAMHVSEQQGQSFVDAACPDTAPSKQLDCLIGLGAESLLGAMDDSWRPAMRGLPAREEATQTKHNWLVLDGKILQNHLWSALADRHADLVLGTTAHSEASSALREQLTRANEDKEEAFKALIQNSVIDGNNTLRQDVLQRYNATWEGLASLVTDVRTVCPLLAMSRAQPNITFYVATLRRNHTDLGSLADVSLDMSAILGLYLPDTEQQRLFVHAMQDLFYSFVNSGQLPPLPSPPVPQPVLTVARQVEWTNDYPNCGFWISNDFVPLYARRD